MRKDKRIRLEAKGWKFGTAKDFLNLSEEESAYIELKIRLSEALRQRRQDKGLSQVDLALSGHLKTGQWWSCQNRPMDWARDSVCSTSLPPDPASPFWFANCAGRI